MQTQFRKFKNSDPFASARMHMERRVVALQEQILKQFKPGPQREIMRTTMNQLLAGETTLQGKIDRLISIVERIDIEGSHEEEETNDCSFSDIEQIYQQRHYLDHYDQHRPDIIRQIQNQSTQYSRIEKAEDLSLYYPSRSPSPNHKKRNSSAFLSPYLQDKNPESNQKQSNSPKQHLRKRTSNLSQGSLLSLNSKDEAVEEGDLFSFRTQGAASPLRSKQIKRSKGSLASIGSQDSNLSQQQGRYLSKSKSKSRKKSSGLRSPSKSKPSQRQSINYDGSSISFSENTSFQSIKGSESSFNSRNKSRLTPQMAVKLYQRIRKRIDLSHCVVDVLNHSNPSSGMAYFLNRLRHERQFRKQLSSQIQSNLARTAKWRD